MHEGDAEGEVEWYDEGDIDGDGKDEGAGKGMQSMVVVVAGRDRAGNIHWKAGSWRDWSGACRVPLAPLAYPCSCCVPYL